MVFLFWPTAQMRQTFTGSRSLANIKLFNVTCLPAAVATHFLNMLQKGHILSDKPQHSLKKKIGSVLPRGQCRCLSGIHKGTNRMLLVIYIPVSI